MSSQYVLVDCNNFYVSCERLFNPRLENRAVIVLSNNDGCVVARSQEAKDLGIAMGEPFFKIKDFCERQRIIVYSSNYQLYGDISSRVMQVLTDMAPEIQIYSIDEAFLLFPAGMSIDAVIAACIAIRNRVKKWVGIPTSLGIGPTKTLAKAANKRAKKDLVNGVFDLSSPLVQEEVLKTFPIRDVWGIGARSEMRLKGLGIHTAKQFRDMDATFLRRQMGVVGERTRLELQGISCLPLEETVEMPQSITCSRSFGRSVTELAELAEALATYAASACEKLRTHQCCARAINVFLEARLDAQEHNGAFRQYFSTVASFPIATSDTPQVIRAAHQVLPLLYRKEMRYKKCGVVLLDLIPETSVIPDLFLGGPDPKRQRLAETVDTLNEKFGKNAIFYGAMGCEPEWKVRAESRTPRYTTSWSDLPVVHANTNTTPLLHGGKAKKGALRQRQ